MVRLVDDCWPTIELLFNMLDEPVVTDPVVIMFSLLGGEIPGVSCIALLFVLHMFVGPLPLFE